MVCARKRSLTLATRELLLVDVPGPPESSDKLLRSPDGPPTKIVCVQTRLTDRDVSRDVSSSGNLLVPNQFRSCRRSTSSML